jgi:acyl carrier protein
LTTERDIDTLKHAIREALIYESSSSISLEHLTDDIELNSDAFRIDSMAFIRALIAVEDEAGIEISDEVLMNTQFVTVGDVISYVLSEAGLAEGAAAGD